MGMPGTCSAAVGGGPVGGRAPGGGGGPHVKVVEALFFPLHTKVEDSLLLSLLLSLSELLK
jgi:hypothetical protein